MRPKQWIKNALVVAAAGAAGALGHDDVPARVALATGAFCLLASGIYAVNDVLDAPEDRRHPVNRHRPVAAGALDPIAATGMGLWLMLAGLPVRRDRPASGARRSRVSRGHDQLLAVLATCSRPRHRRDRRRIRFARRCGRCGRSGHAVALVPARRGLRRGVRRSREALRGAAASRPRPPRPTPGSALLQSAVARGDPCRERGARTARLLRLGV